MTHTVLFNILLGRQFFAGSDFRGGYPGVDWKKAKGMRDIITYPYAAA